MVTHKECRYLGALGLVAFAFCCEVAGLSASSHAIYVMAILFSIYFGVNS